MLTIRSLCVPPITNLENYAIIKLPNLLLRLIILVIFIRP